MIYLFFKLLYIPNKQLKFVYMKVIDFIHDDEAVDREEVGIGGMGGFFQKGMRWKDYIERYTDEGKVLVENLREAILEHGIRCSGQEHQYTTASVPVFEDGSVATYSYRAWGDLMAAIYSEHENVDYSYMDFYV